MRRSFSRRRRRGGFGRRRGILRKLGARLNVSRVLRFRGRAVSLTVSATNSYVVFKAADNPGLAITTDFGGTNIAQARSDSHLSFIELHLNVVYGAAGYLEWALMKEENANALIANPSDIMTLTGNNDTNIEIHKRCLSYGLTQLPANTIEKNLVIRIKRPALRRNNPFQTSDQLKLYIAVDAVGSAKLNIYGKAIVREP